MKNYYILTFLSSFITYEQLVEQTKNSSIHRRNGALFQPSPTWRPAFSDCSISKLQCFVYFHSWISAILSSDALFFPSNFSFSFYIFFSFVILCHPVESNLLVQNVWYPSLPWKKLAHYQFNTRVDQGILSMVDGGHKRIIEIRAGGDFFLSQKEKVEWEW